MFVVRTTEFEVFIVILIFVEKQASMQDSFFGVEKGTFVGQTLLMKRKVSSFPRK